MNLVARTINNLSIAFAGPVIGRRDACSNHASVKYRILQFVSRVIKYFYNRTLQTQGEFTKSIYGVWLKKRDDNTYEYCVRGNYGYEYSQHLKSIREKFTFLDIGSNVGLYSLIALTNRKCKEVHCFDPDSTTIPFLTANLERTKSKVFQVHPYAVSTSSGTAILQKEAGHSGASTLAAPTFASSSSETVTTVDHNYLDSVVAQGSQAIHLKLDVEGHEMSVLNSLAKSTIIKRIVEVFAEFNPAMSDTSAMQQWFDDQGFIEEWRIGSIEHWDALYVRKHP